MSYGMIYVVPHSIYPNGYHCEPKLPLPFITIASQKNFIALYHIIYAKPELLNWFVRISKTQQPKIRHGKSVSDFKKMDQIPFDLIAELVKKKSSRRMDYLL
jgi:hypothetical protein